MRLLFMIAVVAGFAPTSPAHAIVGASREGGPRGVVMVLTSGGPRAGFCSGVALAPHIVLTAAHCVSAPGAMRVFYRAPSGVDVFVTIKRVAKHGAYRADAVASRARSVDLALVETEDALPDIAEMTVTDGSTTVGAPFAVAGFGLAREGDGASGGRLRHATLRLRAPISRLLMWLDGDAGGCTGDSGGVVFDGAALVGVIAFAEGADGKACGALTQAVRLAPFRGWIAQTIQRWR